MRLRFSMPPGAHEVISSMAGTVVCAMPVFLVGAVAVQMRHSLHFGAEELGVAVALYYLGAGASSIGFGHLVERVGGLRTMRISCAMSGVVLLLTATVARSVAPLVVLMVAGGLSSAAMQPAANQVLARRIPDRHQGFAFGVKQSAVPLATLLAGLAVPALALTVGWRWAFAAAACLAALTTATLPRPARSLTEMRAARSAQGPAPLQRRLLVVLAVGFGLGVGAASALAAFLVSSAADSGVAPGAAGLLASLGGALCVASRVVNGHMADRRRSGHFPVIAGMLGVGAAGYALLAAASAERIGWLFLPAVALTFAAGWGWNGLFNYAVVQTHPESPARATGVTQTGGRLGGVVIPFLFGEVASHGSYSLAWVLVAASALLAAMVMFAAERYRIDGERRQLPASAGTEG